MGDQAGSTTTDGVPDLKKRSRTYHMIWLPRGVTLGRPDRSFQSHSSCSTTLAVRGCLRGSVRHFPPHKIMYRLIAHFLSILQSFINTPYPIKKISSSNYLSQREVYHDACQPNGQVRLGSNPVVPGNIFTNPLGISDQSFKESIHFTIGQGQQRHVMKRLCGASTICWRPVEQCVLA